MTLSRLLAMFVTSTTAIQLATAQPQPPVNAPHPPDRFVTVNGINLQYVDWGGSGDVLLFLTGLGASAHQFDAFAPRFVDSFHVIGVTRRGQGLSDRPPSGYDTATLAGDLLAFLDALGFTHVNLIAHSISGVEMTRFSADHPERVKKLFYLDAWPDNGKGRQLMADAGIPYPPYDSDAERQINTSQAPVDLANVNIPALAFFVIPDKGYASRDDRVLCPGCTAEVAANVKLFWQLVEDKEPLLLSRPEANRQRGADHQRLLASLMRFVPSGSTPNGCRLDSP